MDASTLSFPKTALCARRPEGMIEFALYDASNDNYKLCWSTILKGGGAFNVSKCEYVMTKAEMEQAHGTLDIALSRLRPEAYAKFEADEAKAGQPV